MYGLYLFTFVHCISYSSAGLSGLKRISTSARHRNNTKMNAFFEDQKNKFTDGFMQMKDTVNTYVEDQQRKISLDINSYLDTVRKSGKIITEAWSYLPCEDKESLLENADLVLTVPSVICRHGYPCETHTVYSEGYLLNVHRIPHPKNREGVSSKTVILQHGLMGSSADWIMNGPNKALAYVLADAGFDVWLTNVRGNKYSREHAWLRTDSRAYWNFTWHDSALNDLPNTIDYIIKTKGNNEELSYIGHSMGTTILYAMLSLRPEYNDVLKVGVSLAPEVFLANIQSPVKLFAPMASSMASMDMIRGCYDFFPKNSLFGKMSSSCSKDNLNAVVSKNFLFYICGANEEQFSKDVLPMFIQHCGTGTSWKTVIHFAQELLAGGRFQQFDYGPTQNAALYGTVTPSEYDLTKVTLPTVLFWSKNDLLSNEIDVKKLYEKLPPSSTEMYKVPCDKFTHLDYLWAMDAPILVNNKVLEILNRNKYVP